MAKISPEENSRAMMFHYFAKEKLRLFEEIEKIRDRYTPLIVAVEEALREANPNNEPWKCPKFKALAEELEKLKPKEEVE